ncbi:hypothetical protein ACE3YX_005207 [Salmonella enterica]
MNAVSGTLNNVHILENCQIDGRLSAAQIDGDIAKTYVLYQNSVYIPPQVFDMNLVALGDGYHILFDGVAQEPVLSIEITKDSAYATVYRLEKGRAITLSAYELHVDGVDGKRHDYYHGAIVWMSKA